MQNNNNTSLPVHQRIFQGMTSLTADGKPFLTPLFHTQCCAILISESVHIYFCPYNLQWGCRKEGKPLRTSLSPVRSRPVGSPSKPFTQTQVTRQEALSKCVSEEVCCGLLNGHSRRRRRAPRRAVAGLQRPPSGKPQPLLYQPTTGWPGRDLLLIPFLFLSVLSSSSFFSVWRLTH